MYISWKALTIWLKCSVGDATFKVNPLFFNYASYVFKNIPIQLYIYTTLQCNKIYIYICNNYNYFVAVINSDIVINEINCCKKILKDIVSLKYFKCYIMSKKPILDKDDDELIHKNETDLPTFTRMNQRFI